MLKRCSACSHLVILAVSVLIAGIGWSQTAGSASTLTPATQLGGSTDNALAKFSNHCADPPDLKVATTLITPQALADAFGQAIARRFVALQIILGNENKDMQLLVNNLTISFRETICATLAKNYRDAD